MRKSILLSVVILLCIPFYSIAQEIKTGAEQLSEYLPLLQGKKVGLTANHTSLIGDQHLLDVLLAEEIDVKAIYPPEHGFRGTADAGTLINNSTDAKTGIPIISLYGKNKKPSAQQLKDIDVMVFDMQDVGVRFYTYLSTMHYVMEACAENKIPVIVLDRPNPNGFYVDGPVLKEAHKSFIGMHTIPVVHGMTLGELALMINHEGWLKSKVYCDLTVIPCKNYKHNSRYNLPVKPSPNLPNSLSVYLYPSICFFEGTPISLGRGTDWPFQVFGHPAFKNIYTFSFTPQAVEGAQNPPLKNQLCYGVDLTSLPDEVLQKKEINLTWLVDAYKKFPNKEKFFTPFFTLLAGNEELKKLIVQGKTADEIRATWQPELEKFKTIRKKYLLYTDFE